MAICTLEPDINQCPYYNDVSQTCNGGPQECGFYKKTEPQKAEPEQMERRVKWMRSTTRNDKTAGRS